MVCAAGVVIVLTACAVVAPSSGVSAADDALHRAVLGDLKGFTDWLAANKAKGYIGEVGWPNGYEIVDDWYAAADAAKLWVTAFAAGEAMTPDHWLRIYGNPGATFEQQLPITSADPSAAAVEAHPTTADYMRGVHNYGTANCHDPDENNSPFSNHTPYVYGDGRHAYSATFNENACYHIDGAESLRYLAQRGIKLVRLDFRWEHVQGKVGGELRADDVRHIVDWVHNAQAAGLTPIIDMHNYGHLLVWKKRKKVGVSTALGTKKLPIEAFADVWRRLSDAFKGEGNVAYDLMNEPEGLGRDETEGARIWEQASQAALDAIRANGDNHLVMVEGYNYAAVETWPRIHPTSWIRDPADNFRYEGHQYFDREGSGYYSHTYDAEVADAQARGA
jgi:hypothetical protein